MAEFFYKLADSASIVITSRWFWIVLCAVAIWCFLVFTYRKLKLRTLEKIVYTRSFSTDGIFVGETLELVETVSNPSWFPLFAVKMEFFMPS